jgi:3-oxoacyl-(acyl-carrier-protein) synthase
MISASAEWANRSGGVAIIGMAGRFPGAEDIESFWRNLRAGVESIRFFSEQELRAAGISASRFRDPSYLPASGYLPGIEQFDAGFFGFTPREAQITDPQHRLFLESCWTALESAGYDPKRFPGLIGVYAGCGSSEYLWRHVFPHFEAQGDSDDFQLLVASDKDFLSTRVSYKLDLHGPSLTVQTACSTALVAICMAWQSLLTFQCDMALAGGVSVDLQGRYGHLHREGMIMSPDGHCRAFDAGAQGTVGGDGVGVIVLKRLEDALAKGDHIYAVIKGAALNNDGSSKVGYTAPSIAGQTQVIAQALAIADIAPATVSYIEAHGTGTPLGDPIEIAALSEVFRGVPRGSCAIGSVKTNIGHLNSAAGVAGLIKTVQALRYRELPPSLHFTTPNPKLELESSPFFVNTKLRPCRRPDRWGRRALFSCSPCRPRPRPRWTRPPKTSPRRWRAVRRCRWPMSPTRCMSGGSSLLTAPSPYVATPPRPVRRCAPAAPRGWRPTLPRPRPRSSSCCPAAAPSIPTWDASCTKRKACSAKRWIAARCCCCRCSALTSAARCTRAPPTRAPPGSGCSGLTWRLSACLSPSTRWPSCGSPLAFSPRPCSGTAWASTRRRVWPACSAWRMRCAWWRRAGG